MSGPRCHILFQFREGPWGGSNQFLVGLRDQLKLAGRWAERPDQADVILFDSFNEAKTVIEWKRRLPGVPFVHRIDGPVSVYRGADRYLDRLIHALNAEIADGAVFQSGYSRGANLALGMAPPRFSAVVVNAAQDQFFSVPPMPVLPAADGRIRLIATSWSPHWNKGFEIYRHLDQHLDFSRYAMTFVGNSPIQFQNITHLPPQGRAELAVLLRQHDIFISASRHESCPNSVLEALACNLPVAALNSGGQPELVGEGGGLFEGIDDVIACLDRIAAQREEIVARIPHRSMAQAAEGYARFCAEVVAGARPPKRLGAAGLLRLKAWLAWRRMHLGVDRLQRMIGKTADAAA
jgi:glycosyltransferase involved in cell wall biosynthesis